MSEPRHRIPLFCLPDGRYVDYDGLAHRVSNLSLHEVAAICAYRADSPILLRMGLFENPSFLLHRICSIWVCIRLDDPEQVGDVLQFFLWLCDHFLPFLAHSERNIANLRRDVGSYLLKRGVPPIAEMISTLRNHLMMFPKRLLCCIVVTVRPPIQVDRWQRGFLSNCYLTGLAVTHLNGTGGQASQTMARRLGLTLDQLTEILMILRYLPQIRGKSFFWRKIHVITIALNFFIRKINQTYRYHLLRRVLRGL